MTEWLAIGVGFLLALLAWMRARGLARRLEQLTHQYWELRYEHGQLRAQVRRLDPDAAPVPDVAEAPPPNTPAQTFIPLSSLKR